MRSASVDLSVLCDCCSLRSSREFFVPARHQLVVALSSRLLGNLLPIRLRLKAASALRWLYITLIALHERMPYSICASRALQRPLVAPISSIKILSSISLHLAINVGRSVEQDPQQSRCPRRETVQSSALVNSAAPAQGPSVGISSPVFKKRRKPRRQ